MNAQSDAFLSQHADLFASSLPSNNTDPAAAGENGAASAQGGNATPAAGVKLSFTTAPKPAAAEAPKARPTALALEDEDEGARKKRELIPLEYSDDEGEKPRLSRSEADRKAREIEGKVPTDKAGLWAWKVRWKRASEVRLLCRCSCRAPLAHDCFERRTWSSRRLRRTPTSSSLSISETKRPSC